MKWIIARNSCSLYEWTCLKDYNKSPTTLSPERFLGTVKQYESTSFSGYWSASSAPRRCEESQRIHASHGVPRRGTDRLHCNVLHDTRTKSRAGGLCPSCKPTAMGRDSRRGPGHTFRSIPERQDGPCQAGIFSPQ